MPLPIVSKQKDIQYHVTVYDFPQSTVRHQVPIGESMVEKVSTYADWLELEAKRIGERTAMSFGIHVNKLGQISLVVTRKTPLQEQPE